MASDGGVFWLESDPESGLNLIHTLDDNESGSAPLLSRALGVRSDVNGYGGGALCAADDKLFAVHSSTHQIYTVIPSIGSFAPLTEEVTARYGGLVWDQVHRRVLAVRESENTQSLVFIEGGEPRILHSGEDFYSAPAVSASGRQLAWYSWRLPNMPWVETVLWHASVRTDGTIAGARPVPLPSPGCVQQPTFVGESLIVMSDHQGWWQPWQWSESDGWVCLDTTPADHANAPWQLGESHHVALNKGGWVRVRYCSGMGELWWQADAESDPQRLASRYVDFRSLRHRGSELLCIARSADRLDSVLAINLNTGDVGCLAGGERPFDMPLSTPEPFDLAAGSDVDAVSGFYYAPLSQSVGTEKSLPPLVMVAHGGPTAAAYAVLNLQIQFLCHQGFAVAEVNYRGSSGQGRAFRMALAGEWGRADVEDVSRAAQHLAASGKADGQRMVIQGRSSGGYTALMAMVSGNVFAAAVSQFGVSDPVRLRDLTHRFESGYLDWLLGPLDSSPDHWRQRSPLALAAQITGPVAFFQGGQDDVVVPQQTEAMAEAIRANGAQPIVKIYPEEGHGFRKSANQADMLRRLVDFYRQSLNL